MTAESKVPFLRIMHVAIKVSRDNLSIYKPISKLRHIYDYKCPWYFPIKTQSTYFTKVHVLNSLSWGILLYSAPTFG